MAGKSNGVDDMEWSRAPPSGTVWQRLLRGIYNHDEKSFLGRTPKRWGIAVVFYLVFYVALGLLFSACMGGLYWTLDPQHPKFTLGKSLIGIYPGVAYRPFPCGTATEILLQAENTTEAECYTDQLDTFLEAYEATLNSANQTECVKDDNYGYPNTPCFYIKVNKIFDWKPECHSGATPDMPEDLKTYIGSLDAAARIQIWISCAAESGNSTITYPWGRGLPASYYPYNSAGSERQLPFVAIKVVPEPNKKVTIRCRAWAKNIIYNKSLKDGTGYTRIQLQMESMPDETNGGVTE